MIDRWRSVAVLLIAVTATNAQVTGDLLVSHRFIAPTRYEASAGGERVGIVADRKAYWNDDPVGQFLVGSRYKTS